MLKQVVLILLRPAFVLIAVTSGYGSSAEFADDNWLVVVGLPFDLVGVLGRAPVPSQIFVQAEHIEHVSEWIGQCTRISSRAFNMIQRRGDQACRVRVVRLLRKLADERQPLGFYG